MMKTFIRTQIALGSTLLTSAIAAVLVAYTPVLAVNVTSDAQPLNADARKTLTNITKEADRRIVALESSNSDLQKSTVLPANTKNALTDYNKDVIKSTKEIKTSAEKVKTTDGVKDLAGKINGQYGSFKNANATSALTVNLDSQTSIQKDIVKVASDVQTIINQAGAKATNAAGGGDQSESLGSGIKINEDGFSFSVDGGTTQWQAGLQGSFGAGGGEGGGQTFELANVQDMLDQLLSFAATAAALIAAIMALIEALVSGNFAGAAGIFATILSEVLQIEDLQLDSLEGLVDLGVALTGGQTFSGGQWQ